MSRVGKILAEGKIEYDTLLLHNMTSAWKCFDGNKNGDIHKYNEALLESYRILTKKHRLFHFGDEIIMERHAKVEGNELVIGTQRYKTVVLPENNGFLENTQKLLDEFVANGGKVYAAEDVEANNICSSPLIAYTERKFEDFKVYFFINNNNQIVEADFLKGGKVMDITSGEIAGFGGHYEFAPYDCLVLIDDGSSFADENKRSEYDVLSLDGEWTIADCSENILTLDTCDVYFNDELAGENENVPDVLYMALDLKKDVNVKCEYKFEIKEIPENIFLVCETPNKFIIRINGEILNQTDVGYFADKSFRKLSLHNMLKKGTNIITTEIDFAPDKKIYEDIEKGFVFETEKNKLTFETEFEALYLIGDFSVNTYGKFETLDKNAVRYYGGFEIDKAKKKISLSNIEQQGFPFFSGRITVCKEYYLDDTDYILSFNKKGINCINVKVNGTDLGNIMWGKMECDISKALKLGNNTIEMTLTNNLRNMLGPHHLPEGESYWTCPPQFYRRRNVWNHNICKGNEIDWNTGYCFAETGIK